MLKSVQSRATRLVKGLANMSCETQLKEWNKEAQGGPHCSLQHCSFLSERRESEVGADLFCSAFSERTRGNGLKLRHGRLRLDIKKKISLFRCSGIGTGCPGR